MLQTRPRRGLRPAEQATGRDRREVDRDLVVFHPVVQVLELASFGLSAFCRCVVGGRGARGLGGAGLLLVEADAVVGEDVLDGGGGVRVGG